MSAVLADDGFVIAGGVALIESGVSTRPTQDIDAFSASCAKVSEAAERLRRAAEDQGLIVDEDRVGESFARLIMTSGRFRRTVVKVELGRDNLMWPVEQSSIGPILSVRELAANKVLAAFGRHEARDLCDLHAICQHLPLGAMLADAKRKDAGFDPAVLVEMMERTARLPDGRWPVNSDVASVRVFVTAVTAKITAAAGSTLPDDDLVEPLGDGFVRPYQRSDGTVVRGHRRRTP